jgi:hypothetical protein
VDFQMAAQKQIETHPEYPWNHFVEHGGFYLIDFQRNSGQPHLTVRPPSALPWLQAESFPLHGYTARMFPAIVTDQVIRDVITELRANDRLPSGAQLRATLKHRFGSPGGVARVYRLLAQARTQLSPTPVASDTELRQAELQTLRERAERAEAREEIHQSHWAMEVDRLRQRVAALEPLAERAAPALESAALLKRQLQAAEARIAALERQLIEKPSNG